MSESRLGRDDKAKRVDLLNVMLFAKTVRLERPAKNPASRK